MTPRKRWPNEADWARLDSIELARRIEQTAVPIADGVSMTEIERVQRGGQIIRMALQIVNALQRVGSKTEEPSQ